MKHYGKRIHAFNCPKLQNNSYACVDHVCLYVCICSQHTYDCLSFFLFNVAKFSFLLDECNLCNS